MPFRAGDRYDLCPAQYFLNLSRQAFDEAFVLATPLGTACLWQVIDLIKSTLGRREVVTNAPKTVIFHHQFLDLPHFCRKP
jgi:hypothetical protein